MKRIITFLLLLIFLYPVEAQELFDDFIEEPGDFVGDELIDLEKIPIKPTKPIIKGRYQKADDPNLDPNWDWTSSNPIPVMYYSPNGSTPIAIYNRFVPFWTSGNPLAAEKDMYPEDGWQLVWRDFGIATDAPANPFFALYNKYRGILRFMIYNANNDAYTMYKGELSFRSDSPKTPIFTHSADEKAFTSDFDPNQKELYLGTGAKYNDWITLDFVTYGFQNDMNDNMILHLEVHGIDESKVSLEGDITLDEQLDNSALGGSKGGLDAVIGSLEKGHKYYKGVDNLRDDLLKSAKDSKNADTWWAGKLNNILGSKVASALPVVSGVVGLISAFIGGKNKAAPREPMKFTGTLDLTGTISHKQTLIRNDFKTSPGGFAPDRYTAINDIDWGVLSFTAAPRVGMQRVETCREDWYTAEITCYHLHNNIIGAQFPLTPYHFNNDLGMSIIDRRVAYVFANRESTPYVSWNSFPGRVYEDYPTPTGISVKITYRINSAVINSDTELIMVKTIPIDVGWAPESDCTGDCYGGRTLGESTAESNEPKEIITEDQLVIYPNPAKDQVNLQIPLNESGVVRVRIMNINGQIISSEQRDLQSGLHNWNLALGQGRLMHQPNGVYMVEVNSANMTWKNKIVLQR